MKAEQPARARLRVATSLALTLGACALGAALSCKLPASASEPEVLAEFGIFYGGQVQEREQVSFDVDATRQTQGFRLQLPSPPRQAIEVRWEVGMPGSGQRVADSHDRKARPRKAKLGQGRWRPGETVFEQALPFSPGDPLGLWNIRVLVGSRVVLDRPFFVYDRSKGNAKRGSGKKRMGAFEWSRPAGSMLTSMLTARAPGAEWAQPPVVEWAQAPSSADSGAAVSR